MTDFTDAPVSVTFTAVSPKGFPLLVTLRGDLLNLEALVDTEKQMLDMGFKPQAVRTFGGVKSPKQIEYVEERICPKCKNKLIYFESKGKKHIKCSTSKYDWQTKKSTGCDFIEWADSPKNVGDIKVFPDLVTQPQVNLINKLKGEGKIGEEIDPNSLTKKQANEIISSALPQK